MATVPWVEQQPAAAPAAGAGGFAEGPSPGVKIFKWSGLAAADDGAWLPVSGYTEVSMTIELGTIGDSTIAMQGSNEYGTPTKVYTCQDAQGNNVTGLTAEVAEQLLIGFQQIRPKLSGATGTGINVVVRLSTSRAGRRG